VGSGEHHQCTLIFKAPLAPADCTLNLIITYTLASDGMTEIRKTMSLDIPVIQPFHTNFDVLPRVTENGGMPDPFSEGEYLLNVSQTWVLISSITRLGSEKLELQHVGVTGVFDMDNLSLNIIEGKGCFSTNENIGTFLGYESHCSTGHCSSYI
jgi:Gryzun, putative trafficking through Golgi